MTIQLLASDVFRNAMVSGTIAAVVASLVGYFVVLRTQAFAAESLLDVSFPARQARRSLVLLLSWEPPSLALAQPWE